MKRLRLLTLVLVLGTAVPVLPACGPPPTIVTQPGKAAFAADEASKRVIALQDAVLTAHKNGGLPTDTARAIVFVTVNLLELTDSALAGWEATALKAWEQAKRDIPALQAGGAFSLVVATIDEALKGGA